MATSGRATIVSSVQYSTINANGRMIAVDSNRTATVITNEAGNACFTLEVENGLAVNMRVASVSKYSEAILGTYIHDLGRRNGPKHSGRHSTQRSDPRYFVDADSNGNATSSQQR